MGNGRCHRAPLPIYPIFPFSNIFVCVRICSYIFIYFRIFPYICIYFLYVHIFSCMFIYLRICSYIFVYIFVCFHIFSYFFIYFPLKYRKIYRKVEYHRFAQGGVEMSGSPGCPRSEAWGVPGLCIFTTRWHPIPNISYWITGNETDIPRLGMKRGMKRTSHPPSQGKYVKTHDNT